MSHDKIASTFDAWAENGKDQGMETGHGDVVAQVLEQLEIKAGDRVLDLGCGNGWATRKLAQMGPGVQAIGVDVAPKMIARAEELHSYTIRARYELSTFDKLDFKDGYFQRAFSMEALYYAPDVDAALTEVARVLAPGATIDVVIDFYAERAATEGWKDRLGVTMHFLSEAQWREAFERAGFGSVATRRVIDSRGPGAEADFTPDEWTPDWASQVATHATGSLWIHGVKPS